ncbi:MAG: hypothetical protein HQ575_01555 [Candidatus Omnitrophica bacterium]|nr:hypothetical protein [Candidatus Omnitrophota bacterium]
MFKMKVTLFTKPEKYTVKEVIEYLKRHSEKLTIYPGGVKDPFPKQPYNESPDIIISYLSPWIIPSKILKRTKLWNINFHPGPPEYPGIGCFNFAVYNNEKTYGVTAHIMDKKVDTGKIISVKRFRLLESDSIYNLSMKSYDEMFSAFLDVMNFVLDRKELPHCTEKWKRKPYKRNDLEALCKISPRMSKKEIAKRIKASTYPDMPGAYIDLSGYRFEHDPDNRVTRKKQLTSKKRGYGVRILGISPDIWISSAALIEDGKIIAAAPEERFDRQKMSNAFPNKAIAYCLDRAGITINDIDYIVMSWNPALHIKSASMRYSKPIRWRGEYLYSTPSCLLNQFYSSDPKHIEQKISLNGKDLSLFFINHHDAHTANAFLLSPFEKAAILTMDGRGENETCLFAKGKGNSIKKIQSVMMPHSLGLFYGAITEYLGFRPDSDEWKVMALASYGKRDNKYYRKLKSIITLKKDGTFELDLSYFTFYLFDRQHTMYTEKLIELLGPAREKDSKISDRHTQIAVAAQQIFEEIAVHMLNHLHAATGCSKLVLSGGCAMNSVFNGKLLDLTPFKELFISSCPDDSGTSIGGALYLYNCILGHKKRHFQQHNYWGPEFSNKEIKEVLDKHKLKYTFHKDIEKITARLISEGMLIGWFQGSMEFGQRALGNRSILADPRQVKTKDIVNKAVKYRETFRPFAPSVLEKYTKDYFETSGGNSVPFMEKVCKVKKDKKGLIPAVVHIDGTGRLQTVSEEMNPSFYGLISEFNRVMGIPVVLNTSFNINGEPIVCSPQDAVRTFFSCGLDCLVMGNYLIFKGK